MLLIKVTKDAQVVMIDESDCKDRSIIYHSELKDRQKTYTLLNKLWSLVIENCKE